MCIKSEFKIEEDTTLTINEDCSVTLSYSIFDEELEELDWDIIQLSKEAARTVARILTEELG